MDFHLVSEWHLAAPPEAVWAVLDSPELWPQWWPEISRIETLRTGGHNDEGAVRRTWWTSRLPYGFVIDFTTRTAEKPKLLVVDATGDLMGMGRWELTAISAGTCVRYTWQVFPHKILDACARPHPGAVICLESPRGHARRRDRHGSATSGGAD